jgi:hypothetical protein
MENPLDEDLVAIQINRSAADFPPDDGQAMVPAIIQIDLFLKVLVKSDANVGTRGTDENDRIRGLLAQGLGRGMITGL